MNAPSARPLDVALMRLAHRLEARLAYLRGRGRTRRLDALGGLAIEPGEAERILAELAIPTVEPAPADVLTEGVPTFDRAARAFELDPLERDVLLIALAPEVDSRFCRLFGFVNDSVVAFRPTVGLAAGLVAPHAPMTGMRLFLPGSRLVRLGLVELEGDAPLAGQALRSPLDVWTRLAELDELSPADGPRPSELVLAPATRADVTRAVRTARETTALVLVHGAHGRTTLARAIAAELGGAAAVDAAALDDPRRRARAIRDAMWHGAAIVANRGIATGALIELCRDTRVPIVAAIDGAQLPELIARCGRAVAEVHIHALDDDGRRRLWQHVGAEAAGADVDLLATRYRFGPAQATAAMALARSRAADTRPAAADVIAACRTIGTSRVSTLAQQLDTPFEPEELVVPPHTRSELELFEAAARHRHRLFRSNGVGRDVHRPPGIVALFSGPPGTGKTMAAQIMARRLDSDLLRIDLSQVVNKYIGETEKHLDQVFRECEASGAILFFDEADALFGKRTEVKDAHDRYANLEVSFLLQRLEQHPGVSILATNLKQNLDAAFLRRLHFTIDFPFPAAAERQAIWDRHLAPVRGTSTLDSTFLAKFELTGGDIRNAVTTALVMSAEREAPTMRELAVAISRELRKAGRIARAEDFGAWRADVVAYLRDGLLRVAVPS